MTRVRTSPSLVSNTAMSSGATIRVDTTRYVNSPPSVVTAMMSFSRIFRSGRKNVSRCPLKATLPGCPGSDVPGCGRRHAGASLRRLLRSISRRVRDAGFPFGQGVRAGSRPGDPPLKSSSANAADCGLPAAGKSRCRRRQDCQYPSNTAAPANKRHWANRSVPFTSFRLMRILIQTA